MAAIGVKVTRVAERITARPVLDGEDPLVVVPAGLARRALEAHRPIQLAEHDAQQLVVRQIHDAGISRPAEQDAQQRD